MMRFEHSKFSEVSQKWIVLYGDQDISNRKSQSFIKENIAFNFYHEKVKEGFHADIFTEKTTIATVRLTPHQGDE